jgi:hypothetical protein
LLEEGDLNAFLDAVSGCARDDMPPGGAMARIFEVFVRVADESERVDDSGFEQKCFAGLVISERLAAKEHAGAKASIETQRQGSISRRPIVRIPSRGTVCPRKRS